VVNPHFQQLVLGQVTAGALAFCKLRQNVSAQSETDFIYLSMNYLKCNELSGPKRWHGDDSVGGRRGDFYYYRKRGIDNAISIHSLYGPCIKVSAVGETSVMRCSFER
jgi:hypothetical protein